MKSIKNFQLKNINSFSVSAVAQEYIEIESPEELSTLIKNKIFEKKYYIIGTGSNTLFTNDFPGTVIHYTAKNCEIISNPVSDSIDFIAEAGLLWDDFVQLAIENNTYGFENLADIPGTVGAASVQNIGAYGVDQSIFFKYLEAIDTTTGEKKIFQKHECDFSYRTSKFKTTKNKYFVIKVCYELSLLGKKSVFCTSYPDLEHELEKNNKISPQIISEVIRKIRKSKLPNLQELPNAGSFFKNPIVTQDFFSKLVKKYPDIKFFNEGENIKISAAWLIEKCNWKGKRIGNTGTYEKHSLILVNYGNATGEEIFQLANNIILDVADKFNIKLEPEVIIL